MRNRLTATLMGVSLALALAGCTNTLSVRDILSEDGPIMVELSADSARVLRRPGQSVEDVRRTGERACSVYGRKAVNVSWSKQANGTTTYLFACVEGRRTDHPRRLEIAGGLAPRNGRTTSPKTMNPAWVRGNG